MERCLLVDSWHAWVKSYELFQQTWRTWACFWIFITWPACGSCRPQVLAGASCIFSSSVSIPVFALILWTALQFLHRELGLSWLSYLIGWCCGLNVCAFSKIHAEALSAVQCYFEVMPLGGDSRWFKGTTCMNGVSPLLKG